MLNSRHELIGKLGCLTARLFYTNSNNEHTGKHFFFFVQVECLAFVWHLADMILCSCSSYTLHYLVLLFPFYEGLNIMTPQGVLIAQEF